MSPEQAAGHVDRLGPASDIYSLGATLYNILTGVPPFTGTDLSKTLTRVVKGDFPPPRKIKHSAPRALEAIVLKAMALKPEDRYPTSKALGEDIEHWMADEPVTAYPDPWAARAARWARRHKTTVAQVPRCCWRPSSASPQDRSSWSGSGRGRTASAGWP